MKRLFWLESYPRRRIVLLIDDHPDASHAADIAQLGMARAISGRLQEIFTPINAVFQEALTAFEARQPTLDLVMERATLAAHYRRAAQWLEAQAVRFTALDHTTRLFTKRILLEPARAHRRHAMLLGTLDGEAAIYREYRRLAALFNVEFSSFERKRYVNLSHTANKAMNLNAYLSLLGQRFTEVSRHDGLYLEPCADGKICIPDPDYIVMVDADSLITSDYAVRLIAIMERPGNERIAVAQSPYTAIPEAPGALERTAAASTDAQFFNHQGMAFFRMSTWVGASALIRRTILKDLEQVKDERGYTVKVYINDRILIEDAAATIDLLNHGWWVYHDLHRLSYSATPPDFGALIIQRRRWANGGLLILPSLLQYVFRRPWTFTKLGDAMMRMPHLISPSLSGVGLPILLFCQFNDILIPLWIPVATIPCYVLLGCDLIRAGYWWRDLPHVCALNLLLIPVNLAGTVQSLRQAWSGQPVPFK